MATLYTIVPRTLKFSFQNYFCKKLSLYFNGNHLVLSGGPIFPYVRKCITAPLWLWLFYYLNGSYKITAKNGHDTLQVALSLLQQRDCLLNELYYFQECSCTLGSLHKSTVIMKSVTKDKNNKLLLPLLGRINVFFKIPLTWNVHQPPSANILYFD